MKRTILSLISLVFLNIANAQSSLKEPLEIQEQGTFAVGGGIKESTGTFDPIAHGAFNPSNQSTEGQTLHGDHASVLYQIPTEAREWPLVFWHGYGQSMRTWQSTPDGREGFQSIFLRKKFPVYLLDQPRRGLAGQSLEPRTLEARTEDQLWFGIFRMGEGTTFYPNIQFSKEPEALNQFFRQSTPDTGPLDVDLNISAVSALFDKIGDGILVTHSHSGGQGWLTAIENDHIKAIVSYEPGSNFVFPEDAVPEPIPYVGGSLRARGVEMSEFEKLTRIPIVIYYGDYIPEVEVENPGQEQWRAALTMARKWTKAVNDAGGDVTLVVLPEIGIKGNTHFPMSDLNNLEIADLMYNWLQEKGLANVSSATPASNVSNAPESIFPRGIKAPNVHHTGDIWLSHIADADETFNWNVAQAASAPGAKLNWHLHPKGQQLLITHGVGFYQEKGKEVQVVRAGDEVLCPPNVEHWHGAAPNSPVTYLAISGNAPTQWTGELTDEAYNSIPAPELNDPDIEHTIRALSQQKWDWMAAKNADSLAVLFHDKAKFVHMGGTWGKDREVEIIRSGGIHYKNAEVHEVMVEVLSENTVILWNRITLLAVVGGNEVTNPFMVTEVYVKENGNWKLADLTFSKLMTRD
ncbi:MAG: Uncharacterised protein [Cryomorphaceae bacterium]|nr:MAG: Uncharacterised protein [Cryomorphaceae bacterium]